MDVESPICPFAGAEAKTTRKRDHCGVIRAKFQRWSGERDALSFRQRLERVAQRLVCRDASGKSKGGGRQFLYSGGGFGSKGAYDRVLQRSGGVGNGQIVSL